MTGVFRALGIHGKRGWIRILSNKPSCESNFLTNTTPECRAPCGMKYLASAGAVLRGPARGQGGSYSKETVGCGDGHFAPNKPPSLRHAEVGGFDKSWER